MSLAGTLTVEVVSAKIGAGEAAVWSKLNKGSVKIELREGPESVQKNKTPQVGRKGDTKTGYSITYNHEMKFDVKDNFPGELRVQLCRCKNNGITGGTIPIANAGIFVKNIVQYILRENQGIFKMFNLFTKDGNGAGGQVQLKLNYIPRVAKPTIAPKIAAPPASAPAAPAAPTAPAAPAAPATPADPAPPSPVAAPPSPKAPSAPPTPAHVPMPVVEEPSPAPEVATEAAGDLASHQFAEQEEKAALLIQSKYKEHKLREAQASAKASESPAEHAATGSPVAEVPTADAVKELETSAPEALKEVEDELEKDDFEVETIFGLPKNVVFGMAAGLVGVVGFLIVKGVGKAEKKPAAAPAKAKEPAKAAPAAAKKK